MNEDVLPIEHGDFPMSRHISFQGCNTRWWLQTFFIFTPIPGQMIEFTLPKFNTDAKHDALQSRNLQTFRVPKFSGATCSSSGV